MDIIGKLIDAAMESGTKLTFEIVGEKTTVILEPRRPEPVAEIPEAKKPEPETPERLLQPEELNEKKKWIDHGKIVALYTANPPRSVAWIADDMGISPQTVINHLTKEGVYKKRGEKE